MFYITFHCPRVVLKFRQYALGVYTDKGQLWWTYIRGASIRVALCTGGITLQFAICKPITFLSFFQYKARILAYFTSARCEICSKLIIKTPGYVERRVNDKVNNKDNVDIVLASLLLTLSTFHFVLQCFCNWF